MTGKIKKNALAGIRGIRVPHQRWFGLYRNIFTNATWLDPAAATEAEEFFEIYNLPVVVIPTNKKMIRNDFNDQIFRTEKEKNSAIIKKIIDRHSERELIRKNKTKII